MHRLPVVWHPSYEVDIGPHVFPTAKFRLVRERLLREGTVEERDIRTPEPASDADVRLVHTTPYVDRIKSGSLSFQEEMILEVPFSAALRDAMWLCVGGSILTGRLARERGVAMHLGGGFHHAYPDHGEGFCLVNDVAIAVRKLLGEETIRRPAVIDLDVHHGNGTAATFAGNPDVFTMSMHQQHNYPAYKPPSDLDIGLADGTADGEYLLVLENALADLVARHQPDFAFYLAGADPYRNDQLGGLGLSIDGLRRRDETVLGALRNAGASVAIVLAGGYAVRPDDTIEIHCNTVRAAATCI